jgi:hypothetical protein
MPGTIENEHPHKFLPNLRPIEEFRNTPLIPISDRQMSDFKGRLDAYHRRGFYFEVKRETIYNVILVSIAAFIGLQMIRMVLKREEEAGVAIERLRL